MLYFLKYSIYNDADAQTSRQTERETDTCRSITKLGRLIDNLTFSARPLTSGGWLNLPDGQYWIGLRRQPLRLDATVTGYSNWDEQNHLEDCGAIQPSGVWISATCATNKGYICEKSLGR